MFNIGQIFKRMFTATSPEEKAKRFVDNLVIDYLPIAGVYKLKMYEVNAFEPTYIEFVTLEQFNSWVKREVEKRYGVGVRRIKL